MNLAKNGLKLLLVMAYHIIEEAIVLEQINTIAIEICLLEQDCLFNVLQMQLNIGFL